MTTYSSPWEVAEAGIRTITITAAVLDQVLRGNYYVYAEIQALQDMGVTVQLLTDQDDWASDRSFELVDLRRTVSEQLELESPRHTQQPSASTAIWRLPGAQGARFGGEAEEVDRYEPDILIEPATRPLKAAEAERLARRIGALH